MLGSTSEVREVSHALHGSSEIKALPNEITERFQGWTKIGNMRTWRDAKTMREAHAIIKEADKKDIEALKKIDYTGFDVYVEVYQSPDGKVRGYCHYCQSERCSHVWDAVQGTLKSISIDVLEMECGDFIDALKLLKSLPIEEKRKVLKYRGIDVEDLEIYLQEICQNNQQEIREKYKGVPLRDYMFYP